MIPARDLMGIVFGLFIWFEVGRGPEFAAAAAY
jgi:hypothetical protein